MIELFLKLSKEFNEVLDNLPADGIERIKAIKYAEGLNRAMNILLGLEKEEK